MWNRPPCTTTDGLKTFSASHSLSGSGLRTGLAGWRFSFIWFTPEAGSAPGAGISRPTPLHERGCERIEELAGRERDVWCRTAGSLGRFVSRTPQGSTLGRLRLGGGAGLGEAHAGVQQLAYPGLLGVLGAGPFQYRVHLGARHHDDAVLVAEHDVAGADGDPAARDRLAEDAAQVLLARCERGKVLAEHREPHLGDLGPIGSGSVDDHPRDPLELGRQ